MAEADSSFTDFNARHMGVVLGSSALPGDALGILLTIQGSLETGNAGQFQDAVMGLLEGRAPLKTVIVDLSQVTYISSMGVGALATISKLMAERQGVFRLQGVSPRMRELFRQLGFLEIFQVADEPGSSGAVPSGSFPITIPCRRCGKPLQVSRPGRFRCRSCGAVFGVDAAGAQRWD